MHSKKGYHLQTYHTLNESVCIWWRFDLWRLCFWPVCKQEIINAMDNETIWLISLSHSALPVYIVAPVCVCLRQRERQVERLLLLIRVLSVWSGREFKSALICHCDQTILATTTVSLDKPRIAEEIAVVTGADWARVTGSLLDRKSRLLSLMEQRGQKEWDTGEFWYTDKCLVGDEEHVVLQSRHTRILLIATLYKYH